MSLAKDLEKIEPPDPRVVELQRINRDLSRKLERAKLRNADLVEAVLQGARDAAVIVGAPPKVAAPSLGRKKGSEEVALLHASDWQVGKRTKTYNMDVAEERLVKTMVDKTIRLTDIARADHTVSECVLFLGGDMLEGVSIFPGQPFEVDASLYDQMFRTASIIEQVIRRLLGSFKLVTVYDTSGNHGRIGRKGDYPDLDNTDRMIYRIVHDRMEGETRLTWHHSRDFYQVAKIGTYRPLLFHGHQINSYGGNVPAYGIIKAFNAWAGGVLEPFHDAYLGHFHTPMTLIGSNGRRICVDGSPESGNVFAKEFVKALGQPAQRLYFVDPTKGRVTGDYTLYLDAP